MITMLKLLIHTDSPTLFSGLARCGRELTKYLQKDFEIAYAAWNHRVRIRHTYPYYIYPLSKSSQNEKEQLLAIFQDFNPDFLLSIGDIWNFLPTTEACQLYKERNEKFKSLLWLTIDGENLYSPWKVIIDNADDISVFSKFGKEQISKLAGIEASVVYPGVDKDVFKPLSKDFQFKTQNLPFSIENSFLVLNINQNTDRKNIPMTLEAFSIFAEGKEDVFLFLVTDANDFHGYDLWDLISKFHLNKKVAITKESGPLHGMSDEKLNLVYNLAYVSINTSIGEGLSLPTLEAMAVGTPVMATNYGAIPELLDQGGGYKLNVDAYLYGFNGVKRAVVSKVNIVDKLNLFYEDFKIDKKIKNVIAEKSKAFTDSLTWQKTADTFTTKIKELSEKKTFSFVREKVRVSEVRPLIVIPSWGTHCGIAEYTKCLFDEIIKLNQPIIVFQSYQYSEIPNLIKANNYNLIHLQHEFSFFREPNSLRTLLYELNKLKVRVILTLHSLVPGLTADNQLILTNVDSVIVHCERFKNLLEASLQEDKANFSLQYCDVEVIEMGCGELFQIDEARIKETKKNLGILEHAPIIGSFGFLREQKGFQDFLLVIKELRKEYKDILALLVCPPHEFGSKIYDEMFFRFIERQNLSDNVLVIREYLDEQKLLSVLQCADLFVLNYKDSPIGGGISAAVKTLFRVQRPIIVNEGIAFADLTRGEVLKIRSSGIESLSTAIKEVLMSEELARNLVMNANDFLLRNKWPAVAKKHLDLYLK